MVCHFKDVECRRCSKKGHIARVCRSKPREEQLPKRGTAWPKGNRAEVLEDDDEEPENLDAVYPASLFCLSYSTTDPLLVTVQINQVDVSMEVDTGALLSVLSEDTYKAFVEGSPSPTLGSWFTHTQTGEQLEALGEEVSVSMSYCEQQKELRLLVKQTLLL